ncbi:MAG: Uncharacterised protein [Bacteroidetes bacterium MED-G17]|nr:MAG: Uncharacterised protein [Bacteroidetes bacterium MED-G17]
MIISDIIGLLVFDVIVAFVVSKQIGNVEAIISGNDFTWSVLTALSDPFLYFIFVFGAFPLMGSKFCVRYLVNRYKNSKDYLVDKEKAFQKKELEKDLRILESDLVKIENTMTKIDAQIHNVESDITGIKESIVKKQGIFASNLLDIKRNWDGRLGNLQRIFDGFRTSVEAGDKQLLKNLIEGRAAVYKSGWMRFLNEYFAQEQVNLRVKEMDLWQVQWENENFGEL